MEITTRVLIFFALCVFPVFASRLVRDPFIVSGKVFCDTCQAGFETSASTYVHGAMVKLECKDRKTLNLHYSQTAMTDKTGSYEMKVAYDHGDDLCETALVSSPDMRCANFAPGRERARVILTNNNGIASNVRYANSMGFMADQPMSGCTQVLAQYQDLEEGL